MLGRWVTIAFFNMEERIMKCFIGLGNPGTKYDNTRHNVGFMAIDELSDKFNIELDESKFKCYFGVGLVNGEKVMLVKPQTFMNLSGEGARPLIDYFNIDLDDVFVLYDDMDLGIGKLRLRQKGSAGGHNGIRSLNQHFKTEKYKRVRIGIGRPDGPMPIVKWVLSKFTDEDKPVLEKVISVTGDACEMAINHEFTDVMNRYNGDVNA